MIQTDSLDFEKNNGLIPAVIQDNTTGAVLMLGYMNKESIHKTLKTGKVTFFSRSRNALWTKGETSGNYLHLISLYPDCDRDTILIKARPDGPTCHTGNTSCFGPTSIRQVTSIDFLLKLQDLLDDRKKQMPEGSYTTKLFSKGVDKIAQKVGEEAVETVIAAKNNTDELVYEASDLLFHLMVLLTEKGMRLEDLVQELEKRHHPESFTQAGNTPKTV